MWLEWRATPATTIIDKSAMYCSHGEHWVRNIRSRKTFRLYWRKEDSFSWSVPVCHNQSSETETQNLPLINDAPPLNGYKRSPSVKQKSKVDRMPSGILDERTSRIDERRLSMLGLGVISGLRITWPWEEKQGLCGRIEWFHEHSWHEGLKRKKHENYWTEMMWKYSESHTYIARPSDIAVTLARSSQSHNDYCRVSTWSTNSQNATVDSSQGIRNYRTCSSYIQRTSVRRHWL